MGTLKGQQATLIGQQATLIGQQATLIGQQAEGGFIKRCVFFTTNIFM
jgi:hypothetical protein